jgi:hypothetical protein
MPDVVVDEINEQQEDSKRKVRRILEVISDAFAFVRSAEANAALATVTLEELIGDQIKRNGESVKSNSNQFTPYDYESGKETPAGVEAPRANFLGGSDTARPTKIDFILAVQNELSAVIEDIKANPPSVAEYSESVEKGFGEEDVTRE